MDKENILKSFGRNLIRCEHRKVCTTPEYHCRTCLRNKANDYSDKFSIYKDGYKSKWMKAIY